MYPSTPHLAHLDLALATRNETLELKELKNVTVEEVIASLARLNQPDPFHNESTLSDKMLQTTINKSLRVLIEMIRVCELISLF